VILVTKSQAKSKGWNQRSNHGIRKLRAVLLHPQLLLIAILSAFTSFFVTSKLIAFVLNFIATRKQKCDHVMDRFSYFHISIIFEE